MEIIILCMEMTLWHLEMTLWHLEMTLWYLETTLWHLEMIILCIKLTILCKTTIGRRQGQRGRNRLRSIRVKSCTFGQEFRYFSPYRFSRKIFIINSVNDIRLTK